MCGLLMIMHWLTATCTVQQTLNQSMSSTQRSAKHQQFDSSSFHHDRVVIKGDYEVVHSDEIHLTTAQQLPVKTPCSPQKGCTSWIVSNTWEPQDSRELSLDPSGEWCDEAFEGAVMDVRPQVKLVCKCTCVSMSGNLPLDVLFGTESGV
jgi:hypothetical protein